MVIPFLNKSECATHLANFQAMLSIDLKIPLKYMGDSTRLGRELKKNNVQFSLIHHSDQSLSNESSCTKVKILTLKDHPP